MTATLLVCTTCRAGLPPPAEGPLPGAALHAALQAALRQRAGDAAHGLRLQGVECLSACTAGCAVALSAPGAWSYVYGRLTAADAPQILQGALRYASAPDGLVPWRDRPEIFRKQGIARLPPLETLS